MINAYFKFLVINTLYFELLTLEEAITWSYRECKNVWRGCFGLA